MINRNKTYLKFTLIFVGGVIIIMVEQLLMIYLIPLNMQYIFSYYLIPIVPVYLGITFYPFFKQRFIEKSKELEEPKYGIKNDELTELYSNKFSNLSFINKYVNHIDIYLFDKSFPFHKHSPVLLYQPLNLPEIVSYPKILINDYFIDYFTEYEMDAVILHELYHFIYSKIKIKKILAHGILFSLMAIIILILIIYLPPVKYTIFQTNILFFIIIAFVSLIILLYISFVIIYINEEIKADKFSIKILKTDFISSALKKIAVYDQINLNNKFNGLAWQINKRLKRLENEK